MRSAASTKRRRSVEIFPAAGSTEQAAAKVLLLMMTVVVVVVLPHRCLGWNRMADSVAARESSEAQGISAQSAELQKFSYEILALKSSVFQQFETLSAIPLHFLASSRIADDDDAQTSSLPKLQPSRYGVG
jgi:hypothetical protein